MKIKLICDSMCDIPEEIENKEFVEMIPLTINIDGKEYKDGVDFTKEEFYNINKNTQFKFLKLSVFYYTVIYYITHDN